MCVRLPSWPISRFVIFFFQAEDGIRDGRVTGVQTCALPISGTTARPTCSAPTGATSGPGPSSSPPVSPTASSAWPARSEEHTSERQSPVHLVCRLLLEKKKKQKRIVSNPYYQSTLTPPQLVQ